jgi:hypothetical protein
MSEDIGKLQESTEKLRAALLDKLGNVNRPATVGDIAHVLVQMMLINDTTTFLIDFIAANNEEEEIKAVKALRPLVAAMNENFSAAARKLVARETEFRKAEKGQEASDHEP